MAKNYKEAADKILELVGGKENIASITHCVTRLRFNLRDKSLVQTEELKNVKGIVGVKWSGEQLQAIIGAEVDDVYDAVCKTGGFEITEKIDENLDKEKGTLSLKKAGDGLLKYLSGTMFSLVPILIGASLCKTVTSLLGPSFLNVISESSDLYFLFNMLYNALFYFLPVFVGYTAAKSIQTEPLMGIYLGAILLVPDFMNMVGVRETFAVYGIPVPVANYSQTFFPVVLGVFIMSYVWKFLKKIVPAVVQSLFVPFGTVLIMTPIMFAVCAPIGGYIGNYIGAFFTFMSNANWVLRIIGSVLLGIVIPWITLLGMHLPVYMPAITNILTSGSESFVMPIGQVWSYVIYGMALGAWIKYKNKENKGLAAGYFVSGMVGGVSEPTLYGICMKNKAGMWILSACCGIGGLIAALLQPGVCSMVPSNVFSIIAVWTPLGISNTIRGLLLQTLCFIIGIMGVVWFDKLEEG